MTVNLGIGLPTRVIDYVDYAMNLCLHAENGISGVGPGVSYDRADRNLIDAGGAYVSVPGLYTPGAGGAMELAQKARRVVILMSHCDRQGRPKIVRECTLPLTAGACVNRIYTDLAVIDVDQQGLTLREIAEGTTINVVIQMTGAPLTVPDTPIPTF